MRDLTDNERRILQRIFEQLPDVKDRLCEQSRVAKVVGLDEEGSLRFVFTTSVLPVVQFIERVPVTAIFDDLDEIPVYLLLHIADGMLSELEIYKADGSTILGNPTAERLYF